jgi:hypothetical protein
MKDFNDWPFEALEQECKNLAMLTGEDRKETREKANELFMKCYVWRIAQEPKRLHDQKKEDLRLKMAEFLRQHGDRIAPGR